MSSEQRQNASKQLYEEVKYIILSEKIKFIVQHDTAYLCIIVQTRSHFSEVIIRNAKWSSVKAFKLLKIGSF